MSDVSTATNQRLVGLTLDENSLGRGTPDQEHERAVAIYDLIERNSFAVPEHDGGPYLAHLAMVERRLVFEIKAADGFGLNDIYKNSKKDVFSRSANRAIIAKATYLFDLFNK